MSDAIGAIALLAMWLACLALLWLLIYRLLRGPRIPGSKPQGLAVDLRTNRWIDPAAAALDRRKR